MIDTDAQGSLGRFVRYPPGRLNVLVPYAPRAASALGVTLYTASKRSTYAIALASWCAARLAGGRALPGPRGRWHPPLPLEELSRLADQWTAAMGHEPDGLAVYERVQPGRASLTVLVCSERNSMLVRARRDAGSLRLEREISAAAAQLGPKSIRVPQLVGSGSSDGWHWTGYELMSTAPHRPCRSLDRRGLTEIAELIEAVLSRPDEVPAHWRGAHGDLTPWNLRRARGATWLIDWEDAGWAPPGVDAVLLEATVLAMGRGRVGGPVGGPELTEARDHLAALVAARETVASERRFHRRLLTALGRPPA